MSQRNNSRILIGGLILASVLVVLLMTMLGKLDRTGSGPMVEKGEQTDRPLSAPLISVGSNDGDDSRMATIPDPALTIVVVDPAGLPLHTATIRASKDGEGYEATGRASWDEISVGDWQIEVSHDGFLDAHKKVSVIEGGHANVMITMYQSVDISGRIVDTVGLVVPHTTIQFLRVDDTSGSPRAKRTERTVMTKSNGAFSINLAEAGKYRVIVGAKVSPLLSMDEPVDLAPGVLELEVITQGEGSVELQLTNVPELAKAKDGLLQARIYARRAQNRSAREKRPGLMDPSALGQSQPRRPDRENPSIDGTEGSQPGSNVARRLNTARRDRIVDRTGQDPDKQLSPSGMEPLGPEWIHRVSAAVRPDGTASFTGLTPRKEYRLVLELRRIQFQSLQSFRVDPERVVAIHATVPPMPAEARASTILPLNVIVNYQSSIANPPKPGFYWK